MSEPKEWKFEDVKIGYETEAIEFVFSEKDVSDFVRLSGDANPLHTDDEFARSKGFAGRIIHGALLRSARLQKRSSRIGKNIK